MSGTALRSGMVPAATARFLLAAAWLALAVPGWGQSGVASAPAFAYDVVSIKPNHSASNGVRVRSTMDRYSASGVSLKMLMLSAYNLKVEEQIVGVTGAMAEARFDIEAKVDEATLASLKHLPREAAAEQRRQMMQSVLVDRFKMKTHPDTKELPVYLLVTTKAGSKLKKADPQDTYPNGVKGSDGIGHGDSLFSNNGTVTGQGISVATLAEYLGGQLHRLVEDRTGLAGKFDFTLQWTPEERRGPGPEENGVPNTAPSIFTAVQEQLGLKLESAKGPVETVIVDHVEMPSEN